MMPQLFGCPPVRLHLTAEVWMAVGLGILAAILVELGWELLCLSVWPGLHSPFSDEDAAGAAAPGWAQAVHDLIPYALAALGLVASGRAHWTATPFGLASLSMGGTLLLFLTMVRDFVGQLG